MNITDIAKQLGSRGGQARARNLPASRRQEIARIAARKRWPMLSGKDKDIEERYICPDGYTMPVDPTKLGSCSVCNRARIEKKA